MSKNNLELNLEKPQIMHIDLNSAFATIEQQAHASLRNRPIGITNRLSKNCCLIALSHQAKKIGAKVGMGLQEVKNLIPDLIVLESDPPKYHWAYQQLIKIMKQYSPKIKMKSIDEGIIDFHGTLGSIHHTNLMDIGQKIKQEVKQQLGSYVTINIGIGTNHFLAKLAASLHKPDGLDKIDSTNLLTIFQQLQLTDLPGIAQHYEARLNAVQIYNPIDFLKANKQTLTRLVFKSSIGEDWYQRLRGFEIDDITTKLNQVGRQWVLDRPTKNTQLLNSYLQYICQITGKKLRFKNVTARGIIVWTIFTNHETWYQRKMFKTSFFSDQDIYSRTLYIFNQRPKLTVQTMGMACYELQPSNRNQISLFDNINKIDNLTKAIDEINHRYGNCLITANTIIAKQKIKQKIPFGSTEYFSLLLKDN
jgi:DNA polymerase-4